MSSKNAITTTAFNFGLMFTSGVDPRTGMYNKTIELGELLACSFDLKLAYSYFEQENEGFGFGWSLNLSRYNRSKNRLILSDGRSFSVFISRFKSEAECKYLKLQDMKVTHDNDLLKVMFKDGTVEQFDSDGYLRTITSHSGHKTIFTYRNRRLTSISNQIGQSIKLVYDQSGVTITGSKPQNVVRLRVSGRITDVYLPDNTSYKIQYRSINGLYVIEYIELPTGVIEHLTYDVNRMRLPASERGQGLPAVSKHEIYGVGIPKMTTMYRYSDQNFLGRGLPHYIPGEDSLLETNDSYTYSSTEVSGDQEVTRTYNKFHLLIEETLLELPGRHVMQKTLLEYYAGTTVKIFYELPAQYQLLRKQTVIYYNPAGNSRKEVSEFEYDEYGNQLCYINPYGIKVRSIYYSAEGENNVAPKLLTGIPYLLKTQEISPSEHKKKGGEIAKKTTYHYRLHPSLSPGMLYPVKAKEIVSIACGTQLSETSFTYQNSPDQPASHGAPLMIVYKEGDLRKEISYQYSLQNDFILSTNVKTDLFPDINYNEDQTVSLCNGQVLTSTDRFGNKTINEYDDLGRIYKEVILLGTTYEKTSIYSYDMSVGATHINIRMNNGTERKVILDGLDREIENYATDCAGQLVLMNKQAYNAEGQIKARTIYDDFGSGEVGVTTKLKYDCWGEVCEEQSDSGEIIKIERDKALNSETQYTLVGDNKINSITRYFDELGQTTKEVTLDGEQVRVYNGFGEMVSSKNTFGTETTYTLDNIGRIIKEKTGDVTVKKTYTKDNRNLITRLDVDEEVIGQNEYDSLGRVICETKSGTTTRYQYNTLLDLPSSINKSGGVNITNELSTTLGKIIYRTTSSGEEFKFTFDSDGLLSNACNGKIYSDFKYYPNGMLQEERGKNWAVKYNYSRQGILVALQNLEQKIHLIETRNYDHYHRLSRVSLGNINSDAEVTLTYDKFGRVEMETVASRLNKNIKMTNRYSYDNLSRIISKTTFLGDAQDIYLQQLYNFKKMKLVSKELILSRRNIHATEVYTYNGNGQLEDVVWDGLTPPFAATITDDALGRLHKQSYRYNSLANIIEKKSLFSDKSTMNENIASLSYENGRLHKINNSNNSLFGQTEIKYDDNGNISSDANYCYQYFSDGKLKFAHEYDADNNIRGRLISLYRYSATGLLVLQRFGYHKINMRYALGHLIFECHAESHQPDQSYAVRTLIVRGSPIARWKFLRGLPYITFLVTDYKGTVIHDLEDLSKEPNIYTPYGEGARGRI